MSTPLVITILMGAQLVEKAEYSPGIDDQVNPSRKKKTNAEVFGRKKT